MDETREYAAKLAATARQQHSAEQDLLTELAALRDGIAEVKHGLGAERDIARDDLAKTQERLSKAAEQKNRKAKESHKRQRQTERLLTRLKRAEKEITKSRSDLGRAQADLVEARRAQAQQSAEHESKLHEIRSQVADLQATRAELNRQIRELKEEADQLQSRAAQSEQTLKQRDEELKQKREQSVEAELLRRRLESEQDRRIAAEQRLEQILHHPGYEGKEAEPISTPPRITSAGSVGAYQRHAAAAGYDFARDPLFDLMRHEVRVADRYADWQVTHMERVTSRRRDLDQTLEEQAYAAALAVRWRLIDHPHVRPGTIPTWSLLGCLLDDKSEKYLLTITQERIDEMQSRAGDGSNSP